MGSTDMGDVSQVVPSIHPYIAIGPKDLPGHTVEFREAALSERGMKVMLVAAKAMALTAYDLLTQPAFLAEVQREFEGNNTARVA
jgi:metal-dependent amidase/aminoacylase/carboxypeptidase family protein